MKVLIVASYNKNRFAPFIQEQADALAKAGCEIGYFGIQGKGVLGYLKQLSELKKKIREFQPDIIHAHYGLSGLLANLQRRVPVVTTYHGCDINVLKLRLFSFWSLILSSYNIVVSEQQYRRVCHFSRKIDIIPCGVNFEQFHPIPKDEARIMMGLDKSKIYVLFSSVFTRDEKNSPLAIEAVKNIPNAELIELDGYSRDEVCALMNASDVGLLTSIREGSPMFVKELLACHRPVVSTPVGDVSDMINGISGCYISSYECEDVVSKLREAMTFTDVALTDSFVEKYDNQRIAERIENVYLFVLKN